MSDYTLHHGDCLEVMRGMADNSIDAVVTDPPYFKVKGEAWDRQWDKPEQFLDWMGELCAEWQRLLRPNGSLYVFASPKMARRVGNVIAERFCVLNDIRWRKSAGWHQKQKRDEMRQYATPSETIWFAEHYGADNMAKGEAGYAAKCDELRGFVFEPLRAYLAGERDRAEWTTRQVAEAYQKKTGSRTVTGMAGHWFERVQWALPTEENYLWLRGLFNANGGEYLRREYEELRREYEELRREYEELRRPFAASTERPYTDVWDFATVNSYPGKHPCEKPADLISHIIQSSTRPGAVVLDCFLGSGVTGEQCQRLGRNFIGIEMDEKWIARATDRIRNAHIEQLEIEAAA